MKNELCRLCNFLNKSTVLGTCQAFLMREAFHVLHNTHSMLWRRAGHVEVCSNSFLVNPLGNLWLGEGSYICLSPQPNLYLTTGHFISWLVISMNTFTVYSVVYYSEATQFSLISWKQWKYFTIHPDLTQTMQKGIVFCPFMGHMKVSQGVSVGLNLKQLTLILWTHMEQGHPCTSGPTAGCQEPRTARKHVGRQSRAHSGPTSATRDRRNCDCLYYCLKWWLCPTVTHPSAWLMCCYSLMLQSMLYYANLILMDPHW